MEQYNVTGMSCAACSARVEKAVLKVPGVTSGEPKVTDISPADGWSEEELLALAGAAEQHSEHPLAKAIMEEVKSRSIRTQSVTGFKALAGNGVEAHADGAVILGGSLRYIRNQTDVPKELTEQAEQFAMDGKTPLLFMRNQRLAGIIAVADVIKEDSPQAVHELQNMGIRVVMLTGDNQRTAQAIGIQAGVDEVVADVLPEGKENVIRNLQQQGKVAMVGDGINDAPAVTRADIGIAIGAGTDVAIDAADVVLMHSRLSDVPAAIRLSRATLRNIHENLFWAFIYNIIGIPLAAGVFIPLFGWTLNPMFGAAAMSLSSFCVVSNALRLNLFKLYDSSRDKRRRSKRNPNQTVNTKNNPTELPETNALKQEIRLRIDGMMCEHCEATVKKALESIAGVTSAAVSHQDGIAVVQTDGSVSLDEMKQAVEAEDYKVLTGECSEY